MKINASEEYKTLAKEYQELCKYDLSKKIDETTAQLFYQKLTKLTQEVHNITIKSFLEEFPDILKSKIAVATTGSDGRDEKTGLVSPMELILIVDGVDKESNELIHRIREAVNKNTFSGLIQLIEMKDLKDPEKTGRVGEFVGLKKVKIIPTRALDAKFLCGDQNIFSKYKNTMATEIIEEKYKFRKFKEENVDYAKQTLKIDLKEDKGDEISDKIEKLVISPRQKSLSLKRVDVLKGELYFNGTDIKGHKYGGLRLVQYTVAQKVLKLFKEKSFDTKSIPEEMRNIPIDTSSRIDYLAKRKLIPLSKDEVAELKNAYATMILWYAHLQVKAEESQVTKISVDPEQLKQKLQKTLDLCAKMLK